MKKRRGNIFTILNMLEYIKWGVENNQFKGDNAKILLAMINDMIAETNRYLVSLGYIKNKDL